MPFFAESALSEFSSSTALRAAFTPLGKALDTLFEGPEESHSSLFSPPPYLDDRLDYVRSKAADTAVGEVFASS